MAIENHTFCWNGIVTTDLDKTLAFFPEVLGWKAVTWNMGGDEMPVFTVGDEGVAHVRPNQEGEPAWWNNYLRVDDVDAAVAAVVANGGTVLVPATDIPPGRFATVQSPTGATFSLFKEARADDGGLPEGAIHWVDLHSSDIGTDLPFLKQALGFATSEMPMPSGPYHLLDPEPAARGGAMQGAHEGAPSMWLAWAQVDDADAALARVRSNGGTVISEAWDVPGVGRMGIAQDPGGVVFGVIRPAQA